MIKINLLESITEPTGQQWLKRGDKPRWCKLSCWP